MASRFRSYEEALDVWLLELPDEDFLSIYDNSFSVEVLTEDFSEEECLRLRGYCFLGASSWGEDYDDFLKDFLASLSGFWAFSFGWDDEELDWFLGAYFCGCWTGVGSDDSDDSVCDLGICFVFL